MKPSNDTMAFIFAVDIVALGEALGYRGARFELRRIVEEHLPAPRNTRAPAGDASAAEADSHVRRSPQAKLGLRPRVKRASIKSVAPRAWHDGSSPMNKMNQVLKLTVSLLAVAALAAGCDSGEDFPLYDSEQVPTEGGEAILFGGEVFTLDSNGNSLLSPGEVTKPDTDFRHKKLCSQDIVLLWKSCLMERTTDGELVVSHDSSGFEMCGMFETTLECVDYELFQGATECTGGNYCEVVITDSPLNPALLGQVMCGWRITDLAAVNGKTGELLGNFNLDFVESLGFEILPVE